MVTLQRMVGVVVLGLAIGCFALPASGQAVVQANASTDSIDSIADAFLVDAWQRNQTSTTDVEPVWFCTSKAAPAQCATPPWNAANQLLQSFRTAANADKRPGYLRVAKGRDDCYYGDTATCSTGVPTKVPCVGTEPYTSSSPPYCALADLRAIGEPQKPSNPQIRLGLIISATQGDGDGTRRLVRDIAWQACQANKDDTTGLFSFLFLDNAYALDDPLEGKVVALIQKGQTIDSNGNTSPCVPGPPSDNPQWRRLITNDKNYSHDQRAKLDTGAWAHTNDVSVMKNTVSVADRTTAIQTNKAVLDGDRNFAQDVRAVQSNPVIRFEVTNQTSDLSQMSFGLQCSLIKQLANAQDDVGFNLLFPLFVQGTGANSSDPHFPYSSAVEGTYDKEINLFQHPNGGNC